MLKVLFTVDTELQFRSGTGRDTDVAANYSANVLGETPEGAFGLDYQLRMFREQAIKGIFFVEALHAHALGNALLASTVGAIQDANQEVQLHLHVEWLRRLDAPLFGKPAGAYLNDYSPQEQRQLVAMGLKLLREAGAQDVCAFRAGSFAADDATLEAVEENGLRYDSSYNAVHGGRECRIERGRATALPVRVGQVVEVPVTVFRTPPFGVRPAAVCACSFAEMRNMLNKAHDAQLPCFVILCHSFELLTNNRKRANPIVVRRFENLCRYLGENRDRFQTVGFDGVGDTELRDASADESRLVSSPLTTVSRMLQQAAGRYYEWRT